MSLNSDSDDRTSDRHHNRLDDCTLAVVRALTRPLLVPPSPPTQLKLALTEPWNLSMRIRVDGVNDYSTVSHWREQNRNTALFRRMLDWREQEQQEEEHDNGGEQEEKQYPSTPSFCSLHPYFSFGSPPFFAPWEDVGHCLKHLLLHQVASRHLTNLYLQLLHDDTTLFLATGPGFDDATDLPNLSLYSGSTTTAPAAGYYLLRCHYDGQELRFGYHLSAPHPNDTGRPLDDFCVLHRISLQNNEDWRLQTCIVLQNLARILNCLKDYAVPLLWFSDATTKLSVVVNENDHRPVIQKVYVGENIGDIFEATVSNMVGIYRAIERAGVPHTDRLVAVREEKDGNNETKTVCWFAPVGRSYLPENLNELLDALICVAEALVALHTINVVHRDIRWANVLRALAETFDSSSRNNNVISFSNEWALFDFEYAAYAPQPAFPAHTLAPENHAPEMLRTEQDEGSDGMDKKINYHGTPVDVWGLGYLLKHAYVDLPASHRDDLNRLQKECLRADPLSRPTAAQCLERLQGLRTRPRSREKDVVAIEGT